MEGVAVLACQQQLGVQAILHHVGRPPLAREHCVVSQVPGEVVGQVLRTALLLPTALEVEGLVVEHEDPAGSAAVHGAERVDVDAVGPAMHGMRRAVAGGGLHGVARDGADQLRPARVGLGVDDVDPRRVRPRHHQVAALDVRRTRVGAEVGAAGVPPEVMQLVPAVRQVHLAHEAAVPGRLGVGVHDAQGIAFPARLRREQGDIGQLLGRRFAGQGRRGVEGRVGSPAWHGRVLAAG